MSIQVSVAKAILNLGWKPGGEYFAKTEWDKLRTELKLGATTYAWKSICANLSKNLADLEVIERTQTYMFQVKTLKPLIAITSRTGSLVRINITGETNIEGISISVTPEQAAHLCSTSKIRFSEVDETDLPSTGMVNIPLRGNNMGKELLLITREKALEMLANGVITFDDVTEI